MTMILQKYKSVELTRCKLYIALGSTINHNKWSFFSKNEAILEISKPEGILYYEVNSLEEAVKISRMFIDEFNLGASNWTGGKVYDENMSFIANVSYNGRVWDNENWKIAKEIVL